MAHAYGNGCDEVFPKVRQNTKRTHEAEPARSTIQQGNSRGQGHKSSPYTTKLTTRNKFQHRGHEANYVHQLNPLCQVRETGTSRYCVKQMETSS